MANAANKTRDFLGSPEEWGKSKLELPNIHGLYGGIDLQLEGSGKVLLTVIEYANQQKETTTFDFQLSESDTKEAFSALIENDVVGVSVKNRVGIPDETRTIIRLTNARGKKIEIWVWSRELGKYPPLEKAVEKIAGLFAKKMEEKKSKSDFWKRTKKWILNEW